MSINLQDLATAISQLTLRFRVRRRTAAQWMAVNEVLLDSEIGRETDTGKMKVGDGVTAWTDLPYWTAGDGVEEAPSDGKQYARRDGGWAEVVGGGGGSVVPYGRGNELGSLLHLTGPNNSTTFTDQTGKIWTPYGGAKISDAQTLFGGACAYFDGVDDYLQTPYDIAFDVRFGPLVAEFFICPTKPNDGNPQYVVRYGNPATYLGGWIISLRQPDNHLFVQFGTGSSEVILDIAGAVVPLGQFSHVAVSFAEGLGIVVFLNGVRVAELKSLTQFGYTSNNVMVIGRDTNAANRHFGGYLREFRITRGAPLITRCPVPTGPLPDP